jgi:mannobiose 2-epimerase
MEEHTKRTHGFAYAILACIAVSKATGEQAALHLARESFEWIYRHARDSQYGGYFGDRLRRDGTLIVDSPKCKDIGVHSGLLEAFTYLYHVWPDKRVSDQLAEIVDILCNRSILPVGAHHQYYLADWTPVPHLTWFGHHFYIAYRLLRVARLLSGKEKILVAARALIDHALRYGLDRQRGGFYFAGPGLEPLSLYGQNLMIQNKVSWIQMGALKALLAFHGVAPEEKDYLQWFKAQWRFIQDWILDAACGGVYTSSLEGLPWWQRRWRSLAPASATRKGSDWKDSSHDGLALLYCASCLKDSELGEVRLDS